MQSPYFDSYARIETYSYVTLILKADDTLAAIAAMTAARNSCMHSWRQGVPDTLAAIAAMTAARNSCMHSWRQGVPDTLAAMTTAASGSDYALSCYLDTVREQRHCTPSPSNRCKQTEA